jgi:hypothetical protein
LLRSDEARYGLIYGIARLVDVSPHHYGEEDPVFWVVNDSSGISAVAWRTPPYRVGLAWHAGDPEEAVSLLVGAIHNRWAQIPAVTGHREVTDPFADRWCRDFGASIESTMPQRIYRLDCGRQRSLRTRSYAAGNTGRQRSGLRMAACFCCGSGHPNKPQCARTGHYSIYRRRCDLSVGILGRPCLYGGERAPNRAWYVTYPCLYTTGTPPKGLCHGLCGWCLPRNTEEWLRLLHTLYRFEQPHVQFHLYEDWIQTNL